MLALCNTTSAQHALEMGGAAGFGFTDGVDRRLHGDLDFNVGVLLGDKGLSIGAYFSCFKTTRENDSRLSNKFADCEFCFRGFYGGAYADKRFLQLEYFYCNAGAKLGLGGVNYSNNTAEEEHYYPDDNTTRVVYEKADKSFVMGLEPFCFLNFPINADITLSAGVKYRNLLFTNLHCGDIHIASGNDLNGLVYLLKFTITVDI